MTLPTPSIEYFLLSPMLIVFSVAVVGVLVEAFLPRRIRYVAQVTLSLTGLGAAFVAVIAVSRSLPASGRSAVLESWASVPIPGVIAMSSRSMLLLLKVAPWRAEDVPSPGAASTPASKEPDKEPGAV